MTHALVLERRKAQAIQDAFEVLEDLSATDRLIEAKNEPLHEFEHALSILVVELAQLASYQEARINRLETALNHVVEHVPAGDVANLPRRIEQLEGTRKRSKI
jgi:hypothetical protein